MTKIKVGIHGGAGYAGGELIRLLVHHPHAEICYVHSRSKNGQALYDVHQDLLGDTELRFSGTMEDDVDLVFLCLAHGESKNRVAQIKEGVRIIDLSQDFRITSQEQHESIFWLPCCPFTIASNFCFVLCVL